MLAGVLINVGQCFRVSPCCLWGSKYKTLTPDSLGAQIEERSMPDKRTETQERRGKGRKLMCFDTYCIPSLRTGVSEM